MIYFILKSEAGPIKIGTTKRLAVRFAALSTKEKHPLKLLGVMDGGHAEERALHRRFSHLRVEGEWFRAGVELWQFIKAKTRPWARTEDAAKLVAVPLDAEVLRRAKHVALYEGKTIAEFLTEIVGPAVDRKMRLMAGEMVDVPGKPAKPIGN